MNERMHGWMVTIHAVVEGGKIVDGQTDGDETTNQPRGGE